MRWRQVLAEGLTGIGTEPALSLKTRLGHAAAGFEPVIGAFDTALARALAEVFVSAGSEEAYFVFWKGSGILEPQPSVDPVFRGPTSAGSEFVATDGQYHPPSIWCGVDFSWWAAMHTDAYSTYVACDENLSIALCSRVDLDAVAASLDDPVDDYRFAQRAARSRRPSN
jgi:hypothetical protein